jgi:hypothetical protein
VEESMIMMDDSAIGRGQCKLALETILREGGRRLLQEALELEVQEYIEHFTRAILPPYLRRTPSLDALIAPLHKDYLHRVGRTRRAGSRGCAVSLMTTQEVRLVKRYQGELLIAMRAARLRAGAFSAGDEL